MKTPNMPQLFSAGLLTALFSFSNVALAEAPCYCTWSFDDGNDQQINQMAKAKQSQQASKLLYREIYQNEMNCWSWDACADKPRVYGQTYDLYTFE